jgi:hypothetical protein
LTQRRYSLVEFHSNTKKLYLLLVLAAIIFGGLGSGYFVLLQTSNLPGSCTLSSFTYGVVIRVIQDEHYSNGTIGESPVIAAKITGTDEYRCVSFDVKQPLGSVETNSSGWATLRFGGAGFYYLNINVGNGESYALSVLTSLGATTYVTYDISSGNSTAMTCDYLRPC